MQHLTPRVITIILSALLFVGISTSVHAQDTSIQDAQLRDELRTVLLTDPRTGSLSPAELNSMLDVLVAGVHEQGVADDYVLPIASPLSFNEAQLDAGIMSPWGTPINPNILYFVVLTSLAAAIFLLWWLIHLHKRHALYHEE